MSRCEARIYWFDIDVSARCVRPEAHDGPHRDGIRWFDDNGLQVDGTRHVYGLPLKVGRAYRSLTEENVRWLRDQFAAGATVAWLADQLSADYSVVYQCAHRKTYRDVA